MKIARACFTLATLAAANCAVTAAQSQHAEPDMRTLLQADPAIASAVATISPAKVQDDISRLVSFGTRNTLSSMDADLPKGQGINAAADWIESEFESISKQCGECLEVKRDSFEEPGSVARNSRILKPTKLTNIYAILHGSVKDAPWVLVTGHYDSRATDVLDSHTAAPGANDDASGVAVSLECARALSQMKFPGTIVFVAVAGEEQGLNGSKHLAHLAKEQGWPLEAVLNNDIVGGDTTPGDKLQNKHEVRVFSESVPANASADDQKQYLALGEESDSPSRQLARTIALVSPLYLRHTEQRTKPSTAGSMHSTARVPRPTLEAVLILRRDRFLRGGDHTSFNNEGFAAVRFTEWRENFDHQHQTLRTENGVEYGDLLKFVDFNYVANVARLNAATLATLASAPGEPRDVRVLTRDLDNNTELTWQPPLYAPEGTTYEVVWRSTTETLWSHGESAGTALSYKLNVSKDNVLFGVRAVHGVGHVSLAVAPLPAH